MIYYADLLLRKAGEVEIHQTRYPMETAEMMVEFKTRVDRLFIEMSALLPPDGR